jgi:K+-sensing histidine kinase KdpD
MTLGYDERLRKQCLLAAATILITVVFGLAMRSLMSFGVLPLFLVPVLMSAQFGSRRAGLIATAVSVPVAAYVFVPPAWSWAIHIDGVVRVAIFAADAVLISVLFGSGRKQTA